MDCIFCKIIKGEIKAKTIKESTKSIAFLDAFPLAKGHALVIPKTHYAKLQEMSIEDNADLFSLIHSLIPKVDELTGSSLIAIHNGKDAGQEVPHVHVHLIPRHSQDSAGPVHSMFTNRPKISSEEFDVILSKLKD
jgi:histidine triad (HIT) family protein